MAKGPQVRHDLTQGDIGRTLLLFSLPTLASNIFQSLNGSINTIWVGQFLGESALAATSNANIIMFLMFGAVFGFGMASTVLVGQAIGRRDVQAARRAFGAAVGLVLGGALVIAVVGYLLSPAILHALATPESVRALALAYLRVTFLSLPGTMLLILLTMGLRGAGDAMSPLWFMLLTVVLDSGLNPLFIAGIGPFPRLGIAGSSTATLIANHIGAVGLVIYIYAKDLPIRLRGAEFGYLIPSRALLRTIVGKGLPMGAQMLVMSLAGLIMVGLVNPFGVDTAAAYGVSQQLWTYIQMPAMAIGAAVSAMAAQNIGAGRWDRVSGIASAGLRYNLFLTGAMVVLIILFDRPVMALFMGWDSPALKIARHIQLIASWNFVLFGMTMVYFSVVRANGAVLMPLLMMVIAFFPIRIGFAVAAMPMLGVNALWLSFPLGSIATLAMAYSYYHWGSRYRWSDWRHGGLSHALDPEEASEESLAGAEPAGRLQPNG